MKNKNFKIFLFVNFFISIIILFIINFELNTSIKGISNALKNQLLNRYLFLYIIFMLLTFSTYIIYEIIERKRLKQIEIYVNNILNNKDTFDIRDYNEDYISRLKNDIYKITILLKEEKESSLKEKKNLEIILSDISHQLKTPLTSMYVINDLLLDEKLDIKKRREILNKNRVQLERIEWLVSSLLKISRLDSGVIKIKKSNYSSLELINKALEPLLIPSELKEQKIIIDVSDIKIDIDFNWIREALINIIKNAIEHTPNNGQIKITMKDNPLYIEFNIEDNGVGISEKDLPHIFERFYKVNSKSESIGIGLNMTKKIIDLSGGDIRVKSELNKGTTFTIKLYKNI